MNLIDLEIKVRRYLIEACKYEVCKVDAMDIVIDMVGNRFTNNKLLELEEWYDAGCPIKSLDEIESDIDELTDMLEKEDWQEHIKFVKDE